MRFTSARREGNSVIYIADDGTQIKYYGGDPAWRTNNPGNLWSASVSKRNGEIGKYGNFAIFPDYESGHTTHWNKSLQQMIGDYAPRKDHNKPTVYLRFLRSKTGIRDERKIRDFTSDQFERLWRAIETYEGKKKGKIEDVTPGRNKGDKLEITQVKKNKKGTIVSYKVEDLGWVSKARGIALASSGKIDAVVVTSRSGNLYLRTRPVIEIVNLDDLG